VTPVSDYPFLSAAAEPAGRARNDSRQADDQRPPADILSSMPWMKDYAANRAPFYADYFTALVDEKGWLKESISADGLHPNAEGYKLMVPVVEAALQKALAVGQWAGLLAGLNPGRGGT